MKQPKISISDVPNWIMAIMSITALVVSIVALKQTDTSNHLAQLMYEKSEKPFFRLKTEYPKGFTPTNNYEKLLVKNITLSNDGAPISEINGVTHTPLLFLAVFARNKPELAPHKSNMIVMRSIYEEGIFSYNSEGVIYSAEGAEKQKLIAATVNAYAKSHPDRVCDVRLLDLFKIQYTDALGRRCVHYQLQGCPTTSEVYSRIKNDARAFEGKVRAISEDFCDGLDFCYEFSKSEKQTDYKTK